jgi:pimeloyl-ACP methyl ester carboxylesterase
MALHDVTARLSEITAATTVLSGTKDSVHPPTAQQAMCAAIPNSRLATIDTAHMSLLENPADFSQAIRAHLDWVCPTTS